ncbi:MAG TPA: hypothetical protein VF185_01670 [Patescibacteria group bacterium]
MKNIILFLVFAVLGGASIFAVLKLSPKTNSPTPTPQPRAPFIKQSEFSIENAPSQSIRGTIVTISGDVEWQSRIATESAKITSPQTIQQGESISTKETGKVSLTFPTAANLTISPNTDLAVVQTLPVNIVFSQGKGVINYASLNSIPVSVRSQNLLIQLNQGNMTLTVSDTTPFTTLDVTKGLATVAYNDSENVSQVVEVKEGQRFVFNNDTLQAVLR